MTDRLKDIWNGFEESTTRRLTGDGVDNIPLPEQHFNWRGASDKPLPQDYAEPVRAAFDAFEEQLEQSAKRSRRRKPTTTSFASDEPVAPQFYGHEDLAQSLASTAQRTTRRETDYATFSATDEGQKLYKAQKRKKKFLGLF